MSATQERSSKVETLPAQSLGSAQLAPVSGSDMALIPIIREAVSKGDAEMVHRLLDARDRIRAEEAERAFKTAFIEMWKLLPQISKDGKIELKDKEGRHKGTTRFAKFEDIDELIKPILAEHGFALSFRDVSADASMVKIEGELMHVGGYSKVGTKCLPPDHGPGRNNVQALGSSDSYAKRYITEDLLNLVRRGADNDGNGARTIERESRDNRSLTEMARAGEFNRKQPPSPPVEGSAPNNVPPRSAWLQEVDNELTYAKDFWAAKDHFLKRVRGVGSANYLTALLGLEVVKKIRDSAPPKQKKEIEEAIKERASFLADVEAAEVAEKRMAAI